MRALPFVTLAVLALTACEAPRTLSPDFGASVRHNMAAQIINPVPAIAEDAQPDQDGQRAGGAWERYRTGTSYRPKGMATTDAIVAEPR